MTIIHKPSGVCARELKIELDNGIVKDIDFVGGCPGNLIGLSSLIKDMPIEEVITRLKGIPCGNKTTSCPDQLALALEAHR